MKKLPVLRSVFGGLAVASLLAGCGGGNDGYSDTRVVVTPPPVNTGGDIPPSATASSTGATDYVKSVVSFGGSDASEPLDTGDAVLASSDTDEADTTV